MKKLVILLSFLLLFGCAGMQKKSDVDQLEEDIRAATESGGYWSDYSELAEGGIAATDDFLVRDVSATPPTTGQQKRYQYESLKGDLQTDMYGRECFTLEDPADTDDNVPIWSYSQAFTVTEMRCWTEGGTNVVMFLSDGTNDLDSMTCDADGADDDDSIANASFSSDEQMEFSITSVSGSVSWVNFCFSWTIDSP